MVDAISSLGAMEYRHDEWGVDVTICGSQKGLMMPPGLSFNAISAKAMAANGTARLPRNYWDWPAMLAMNATGYFPYTPGINLLFGLVEVIKMMREEGYANIFARHDRHAEATRRAVRAWGLETQCAEPRDSLLGADRGAHAGGSQRRPAARDHSGEVQHESGDRAWADPGPRVPHRPSRRFR